MKNKSADGLRGMAAFNVTVAHFVSAFLPIMLYNNYPTIFPKNNEPSMVFKILTSPVLTIFYNGHFAVMVFFVLSGYVLTLPYFTNREDGCLTLRKRLWGRYFRLNVPVLACVLLSFIVYSAGWYSNVQAAEISGSTKWLKNFYPATILAADAAKQAVYQSILFAKCTLVPPLWTLRMEFIGSLYILLFYISKPKDHTLIPLLLVFAMIYAVHGDDSLYLYAFFLGSLLGGGGGRIARLRAPLFFIGLYFGGFQYEMPLYDFLPNLSSVWPFWHKKTFYNGLGAILVTASVIHGFGSKVFQSRVAQFLGKISFSIYCIHFIVLCSLASFLYIHLPSGKLFLGLNLLCYISTCFIAAYLFEKFVDRNSISISHSFSSRLFGSFQSLCRGNE
jgi:peptidoglycan/LPS O-acetylase OafA/YrhL